MHRIELSEVPAGCALYPRLPTADFHDCYRFPVPDPGLSALELLIDVLAASPAWIEGMMWLRNKAVRLIGLKDLGALGAVDPAKPIGSYRPGDRIGIFTLVESREDEAVVCDRDRHLDVWLSVRKLPSDGNGHWAAVTTVVRTKNRLGRTYMLVVKPMHRMIVPASLRSYLARKAG
ncbi:hypothetical protein J2848_002988 [Azospirillum lipoferum]|uniref:DUF2867 domain-containing protein n=1 Tax=Azospirillum lipoferum TaxID=193 RepID=A0A5A9GR77_AZOLI|nr:MULTISPECIES: DUF2867 domain-containing protein [Azospirillum]KAA0595809.1 DUF2867 domain-containing protein [Azospirillum lipoferum]MCP1611315.1 hypothetical protein [Azospirillum lipoferum]MDW5537119.1 DUF2867 domain-containing protein [Azospirillum sp. NL1]